MVLGAEGVQIGTRFALTEESSASPVFKEYCLSLGEGDTKLLLKKLAPTRLVKNAFREAVEAARFLWERVLDMDYGSMEIVKLDEMLPVAERLVQRLRTL